MKKKLFKDQDRNLNGYENTLKDQGKDQDQDWPRKYSDISFDVQKSTLKDHETAFKGEDLTKRLRLRL